MHIAKHMKAFEPIVARARFIMEEFIQHVTPLNIYHKEDDKKVNYRIFHIYNFISVCQRLNFEAVSAIDMMCYHFGPYYYSKSELFDEGLGPRI